MELDIRQYLTKAKEQQGLCCFCSEFTGWAFAVFHVIWRYFTQTAQRCSPPTAWWRTRREPAGELHVFPQSCTSLVPKQLCRWDEGGWGHFPVCTVTKVNKTVNIYLNHIWSMPPTPDIYTNYPEGIRLHFNVSEKWKELNFIINSIAHFW